VSSHWKIRGFFTIGQMAGGLLFCTGGVQRGFEIVRRFVVRDNQPRCSARCIGSRRYAQGPRASPHGVLGEDLAMNEFDQRRASDTGARLEGRALAIVGFLLVGIGFWQHYDNYVDAEESRLSVDAEQTAMGPADDNTMAVMPGTSETPCKDARPVDRHLVARLSISVVI
jgi:hypothetical protein